MGLYPGELHPKNVDKPVQIVWPGCIYEALNFHGRNSPGYRGSKSSGAARHFLQDGLVIKKSYPLVYGLFSVLKQWKYSGSSTEQWNKTPKL